MMNQHKKFILRISEDAHTSMELFERLSRSRLTIDQDALCGQIIGTADPDHSLPWQNTEYQIYTALNYNTLTIMGVLSNDVLQGDSPSILKYPGTYATNAFYECNDQHGLVSSGAMLVVNDEGFIRVFDKDYPDYPEIGQVVSNGSGGTIECYLDL